VLNTGAPGGIRTPGVLQVVAWVSYVAIALPLFLRPVRGAAAAPRAGQGVQKAVCWVRPGACSEGIDAHSP
jgi:hypothetical protein